MDEQKLQQLAKELNEQQILMEQINDNLFAFVDKYTKIQKEFKTLQPIESINLPQKMEELNDNILQTSNQINNFSTNIQQGVNMSKKVGEDFDGLKTKLNTIHNELQKVSKQSSEFVENQQKAIQVFSNIKQTMTNFEEIDFSKYQKTIEKYTKNIKDLNGKIEENFETKIKENSEEIKNLENKLNDIVAENENQSKAILQISQNVAKMTELLQKLTITGNVDEQYIFDIIDKWAEESKVKHKKR